PPRPPLLPYTTLFRSVLDREHSSRSPHAGLNFVSDEKRPVARAQLACRGEEAGRRYDNAALSLNRLDDEAGNVARRERALERLRSEEHTSELQSLTNL